jgi:hypothetical protein
MRQALDQIIDLSVVDPDRDGKRFAEGLRRLIASFGDEERSPVPS